MGFISQWLTEQTQARAADKIVDDTIETLKRREGILDGVMPLETFDSRHFTGYLLEQVNTIASVIGVGVEPPLTQHGTFKKVTAELVKTGLARVYDEEYQWQMKEAMELAAMKGIYVQSIRDPQTGKVTPGINNSLAKYIFGSIESLAQSQIDLMDKMAWEALQSGKINHFDPRTKLPITIDYNAPAAHYPAPLVGPAAWDQAATANGIQDLYNLVDEMVETNGYAPKAFAISRRQMNNLMQQQSTKDAATSVRGSSVGTVSPDMLGSILAARQLPNLVTFDERYKYEAEDKTTSNVRFMNENKVVALTEDMGTRAIGPTLENNGGMSGIYTVTREIQKVPPVDATQTVAMMLPCVLQPKNLASLTVG